MAVKDFKFFDSQGQNITPRFENGYFKLSLYFEPVSINLFAIQHLYIFEEVYKQYDPTLFKQDYNYTSTIYYDSLLIRFLQTLETYQKPLYARQLLHLFNTQTIYEDVVDEFAKKNQNYILRQYDYNAREYTYYLTFAGQEYLNEYREKEEEEYLLNRGWKKELVRPRLNYDKDTEEAFLIYRWKEPELEKNIFTFLINYNDITKLLNNQTSLCLRKEEAFFSFVPLTNDAIKIDSIRNPKWKNLFLPYRFDSGLTDNYLYNDINEIRILRLEDGLNQKPFQLNFALTADTEGTYSRTLEVFIYRKKRNLEANNVKKKYITDFYKFAEIQLFGEVIGEDERLAKILENFGRNLDEEEIRYFKSADLDDDIIDYQLLNNKRKELLLIGDEIFPYIGSYKALRNILKFFEFDDIRLREYFYNIETHNPIDGEIYYDSIDFPLDEIISNNPNYIYQGKTFNDIRYKNLYKQPNLKKTTRIGLIYPLNKITGEYDENNEPIVVENYMYSPEEILIKLYGIKKILEKKYLPHNVRIIDITGEGLYFKHYGLSTWITQSSIFNLNFYNNPDFYGNPLKGYLKSLDKLLNIYKLQSGIENEKLQSLDVLKDYVNRNLYEFNKSYKVDFEFQDELPLQKFYQYYPDYYSLKDSIYLHLRNSYCSAEGQKISQADYYKRRLLGQPVELILQTNLAKWDDLIGLKWSDIENQIPDCTIRGPDSDSVKIDTYRMERDYCGINGKLLYLLWDNVGFYDGVEMEWIIKHTQSKYCFRKKGYLKDLRSILIFLPFVGKYDVTCIVFDSYNFPRITQKKEYLEVLPFDLMFSFFGRLKRQINWQSDKTWSELEVSDLKSYCPIKTTFDDCKLNWDSLNYAKYINQNYLPQKDIFSSKILEIDYAKNEIVLEGTDYYNIYTKYPYHRNRNVILFRDDLKLLTIDNIGISELDNSKIVLDNLYPVIKDKTYILIYKAKRTKKFNIKNNRLRIYLDDIFNPNTFTFESCRFIKVLNNKNESQFYEIDFKEVNFPERYVDYYVIDDGALDYDISNVNSNQKAKPKFYFWSEVTLIQESYQLFIDKVKFDKTNQKTILYLGSSGNNFHILNFLKDKNLLDYKVLYDYFGGIYTFDIKSFKLIRKSNKKHTSLKLKVPKKDRNIFCQITPLFNACWSYYDINWALLFGNSKYYNFDEWGRYVTWDSLHYLTYQLLEYHSEPIAGFKIFNIIDKGKIKINGQEFELNLGLPDMKSNLGDMEFEFEKYNETYKWNKAVQLLNECELSNFKRFYYYNYNNQYIQAINKVPGSQALVQIEFSNGLIGLTDSYPRTNFTDWKIRFFKGLNNPANWFYLARAEKPYIYNKIDDKYLESDEDLLWAMSGAFTFSDTFIASSEKKCHIPRNTCLFFIFDDIKFMTNETEFLWELWESEKEILLIRSEKPYFIWNFIDPGNYTIKLLIKNQIFDKYLIERKSLIKVLE